MSDLLRDRAVIRTLPAFVVSAAFARGGACGFALGDGTVRIATADADTEWHSVAAHDGAALCLAADANADGFLSGGDDGRLLRIGADGSAAPLLSGRKWLEHCASAPGYLAGSAGREVHLFDAGGAALRVLEHPSTVTGLAFDARGKRLAVSHVNGASLWFTGSRSPARMLEWKGSHIAVALHPDAQAVVTAMQENALHGWRLADGQHMRMTGYPAKTESLAFTRGGKWLASSGADSIVLWPFFGGGPMGKAPTERAQIEGVLVTRVAPHPKQEMVAAGYANGVLVLADIASGRVLPLREAGAPVSALCWSTDGAWLAYGCEDGTAAVLDLAKKP